ncbi:MAG TPA: polysaccharide biosynthesis tyrosine autokinase [Candidatus Acidoferrum sp.]|nr:polysaccharide biosynthesis tyrosine autokinase [Candidatus Acidoferrum sp.]
MAQYEMNLRDYWVIIRRRRLVIIASTLLVALLSLWFSRQKVPIYESTSSVRYEQSTSLTGLLVEVLAMGSGGDNIETQGSVIKSYPVLEEALRRMGKLPERPPGQPLRESRAYLNALDALGRKVRTTRVAGTSILEITATSLNPGEAREIADTIAESYRDYNRQIRNSRITEARKYIEKQMQEAEGRVKGAEEQVWAYREKNSIITPGAESTVLLSLFTQLRGNVETSRQQRVELEGAQARLARIDPGSFTDRVFVETANPVLQRLQTAQVDLLLEYNNLALEVTERHPRLQALGDRMREVRLEMRREIGAQIALLKNREDVLSRQMGDVLQKNREVPAVELGLQRLQRDAKTNEDLLTLLRTKHQEALIKESERVEEVSIVRPATDPAEPPSTDTFNTVFIGGLLGLMLGLVLAFVQETLDTSIGTIEDVESYLQVPVVGIVPHIDVRETVQRLVERRPALARIEPELLQSHALLITHFDPKSPVAEAYRTIRTNLQFIRMERAGKVLVFTSPTLQEGKTTTIVNVALTMAQSGQRTLLVGANMRRPSLHRFFGIEREPGLSDILVGHANWRDCIRTVADIIMGRFEMEDIMAAPGLDNLHIIESGPIPANPSELLSTPAMATFLREVREEYDVILIDTPPVLPVTDSAIVAGQADGVVLVYQAGKVGRLVLKRAKAHLETARASVLGVVLNDVQSEIAGYTYAHYYTHYYGEEPGTRPPGRFARLWGRLRGRTAAASMVRKETPAEPPVEAVVLDDFGQPRRSRLGKYTDVIGGVLVVLLLLAVIFGITARHLGWFSPEGRPRAPQGRAAETGRDAEKAPGSAPTTSSPATSSLATPPAATSPVATPPAATSPVAPKQDAPSAPVAAARESAAREAPSQGTAGKEPVAVSQGSRFAVEFGPFLTAAEAERTERQLNEAGHQTVRFRQQAGSALYVVLIERVPDSREAQTLVATLREQGFPDGLGVSGSDGLAVRVGEPMLLRAAVQLAESLRTKGHQVRVAAQPGQAQTFVIRHGNFASREEAEGKAAELARLSLPNRVVRAK